MGQYTSLTLFLENEKANSATLTFAQIEIILGEELPSSARGRVAWWIDSPKIMDRSQNKSWSDAGFTVSSKNLDLLGECVTFSKL